MSSQTRLLLLIPDLGVGGAQRQLLETARSLSSYSKLSIIICTIFEEHSLLDKELNRLDRITVVSLKKKKGKWHNISALTRLVRLVKEFQPDIIHAFLGKAMRFGMFAKLFYWNSKLIFAFRLGVGAPVSMFSLEQINFWIFKLIKFPVDAYTCNSKKALKGAIQQIGYSPHKGHFIPNGIDIKRFYRKSIQSSNDVVSFLCPARIIGQKNQLGVVAAVQHLLSEGSPKLPFKVVFVGMVGDLKYQQQIDKMISSESLLNYFEIKEATNEILSCYYKANAVLLPSLYEGFPNVLLEAWACGKPILISNEADTANLVANYQGGFKFSANSPLEIAKAMNDFLSLSVKEQRRQGEIGYNIVRKEYQIEKIAERYFILYQNLCDR